MATRGRPPGSPKVAGSGRVKKSLDRQQRVLVGAELAHSIMATFEMLGGTAAMVEWAADNPTIFYTQILSRLMPAPQKDDPDIQINQQFNTGLTEMESARRVAFALAKAVYADPTLTVEHELQEAYQITPQQACDWRDPVGMAREPLVQHEPVEDPRRAQWGAELKLSPQERADLAAVRETHEASLANYHGGPGEQGGPVSRPTATKRKTSAELCRSLSRSSRRRDDLL